MCTSLARRGIYLLISTIILGLSASAAAAQTGTIRGTVANAETGEALIGAHVLAATEGFRRGTSTVSDGDFVLSNLPGGVYVITVTYVGYKTKVLEDIELASGGSRTLQIQLIPTVIEIGEVVVVTASKLPEKLLDAPAAVNVIESREIEARPALAPSDYLTGLQGVDRARTGIAQDRVVVRGFNAPFTGRLQILTDNRIAHIPSLRFNAYHALPITNDDIQRIEVLYGPGSALYGPNTMGGVMHIITKSPFESQGTSVSIGGGEQSLLMGSFRHAGTIGQKVGYKISAQQYRGKDWEYRDPAEPDSIVLGVQTATGRVARSDLILNKRDFGVERISSEARVDYRPNANTTLIFSGGLSRFSDIEVTGSGAYSAVDWIYTYLQGRLIHKDLFAQVYLNKSDAGDTYSLRSGDILTDNSSLFVSQIQHGFSLMGGRQRLTYSADLLLTRPDTENTMHGRNEDNDNVNEIGAFVQSETSISSQLRLIATARVDDHNRFEGLVFSPRAAVVYEPNALHNFRFTYNRAFEAPRAAQLFFDLLLKDSLGPFPYALRLRGTPDTGFHFKRNSEGGVGGLYMQSIFTPSESGGRSAYLPAEATVMWDAVAAFLQTQGIDLSALPAPTSNQIGTTLGLLNVHTGSFEPIVASEVVDIPPLKPLKTTTFEFGYKGLINNKLLLIANFYRESSINRGGGNWTRTPNVFFDEATLAAYLENYMPAANAAALASSIAAIPVGTVTPEEGDPADLIYTRTNLYREISYYGTELGLTFFANQHWNFTGTCTYLSKNFFPKRAGDPDDIALNASKFKLGGSVVYTNRDMGLDAQLRARFIDKFPIVSSLGRTDIDSYTVFDLNVKYRLPFYRGLSLTLSLQNLLNNMHREFIGCPEIGRLGMLRLTYSL